jgi:hypothetical protein
MSVAVVAGPWATAAITPAAVTAPAAGGRHYEN